MNYDVSGILKVNGSTMKISESVDLNKEKLAGYQIDKIENARFTGTITNNAGLLKLNGRLSVDYFTCCSRCLKPLAGSITLGVEESFSKRELSADDDMYIYEGTQIPLGEALTNCFIMDLPVKDLCRDDCKGICTDCGADLNEKECSCNKEYVNPKFEALKSIYKKD